MSTNPVRTEIQRRVKRSTYAAVAAELGVSMSYLYDAAQGKREPGPSLLKALGYERRLIYKRIAQQAANTPIQEG